MNIITPPQRDYLTPVAEVFPLSVEQSFCQSNIKDYPDNPIVDPEEDA